LKEIETSHFWAGHFTNVDEFEALFAETYSDEDDIPISPFAASQNEIFYDHDLLEYGISDSATSIKELVEGYSYADQWLSDFEAKLETLGLTDVNAFIFISADEIDEPQSIGTSPSSYLRYLGSIPYRI
jgi:hypothetical protein